MCSYRGLLLANYKFYRESPKGLYLVLHFSSCFYMMFADDTKIWRKIECLDDHITL